MKKIITLVLSMVMLLSLVGCNSEKETASTETPTIKVYIPGFNIGNAQSIIEEINKKAKVNLVVLESAAANDAAQRSALIITTGEKVNWINITNSQPFKDWGENGFLTNLAPYLKKYKEELPVLNMIANDDVFKSFKGKNGEIFVIPGINYITNYGIRMNKEWLEKTGLEMPKTLDEYTNVLQKFKTISNGEKNAAPFVAGSLKEFEWIFLSYGGRLYSSGYPRYYKKGGNFAPYDISDMNKEALKYARMLYQEGLVNSDWQVLNTTGNARTQFVGGKAGIVYQPGGVDEELYQAKGTVSVWPEPPTGPNGNKSYGGDAPCFRMNVIPSSITDEKDIHNTLKFIEWMHSEEGRKICCYGVEGRHYELTKDGKIDYNAHRDNMDADFGKGNNSNFEWGWVSPFKGALDPSNKNLTDALTNMKFFEVVKKEPVDENYSEWILHINKYVDPYPYAAYTDDDLRFAANTTIEFTDKFYARAITQKDFDIDSEWEAFKSQYMNKYNGQKCLDLFTKGIATFDVN